MDNQQFTPEQAETQDQIDLVALCEAMLKRARHVWPLLLAVLVLLSGFWCFRAKRQYQPVYTAYSSFVISTTEDYYYGANRGNSGVVTQLNSTFPYILSSSMLRDKVANELGLDYIPGAIRAEAVEDTNLFTIYVTAADAELAYRVLQSVIDNYPKVAEYVIGNTVLTPMDDSGIPTQPDNPLSLPMEAAKGACVGLLLDLVFLVLVALTRSTVVQEEDLRGTVSVASFGAVPLVPAKKRSQKNGDHLVLNGQNLPNDYQEALRTLRARLEKQADAQGAKLLLFTGSVPGEGTSTLALNLALSMGHQRKKVLLIDGNLRQPKLASLLKQKPQAGLCDFLKGYVPAAKVLVRLHHIDLLLGGAPTNQTVPLLKSERFADLLQAARKQYDYVLVDVPAAASVSDASVMAPLMDGIVLVVRQDHTKRSRVLQAMETLSESHTPILGFILNMAQSGVLGSYGYGYGYGKYGYGKYGYGKYGSSEKGKEGDGYGYGYGSSSKKKKVVYDQKIRKAEAVQLGDIGLKQDSFSSLFGEPEAFDAGLPQPPKFQPAEVRPASAEVQERFDAMMDRMTEEVSSLSGDAPAPETPAAPQPEKPAPPTEGESPRKFMAGVFKRTPKSAAAEPMAEVLVNAAKETLAHPAKPAEEPAEESVSTEFAARVIDKTQEFSAQSPMRSNRTKPVPETERVLRMGSVQISLRSDRPLNWLGCMEEFKVAHPLAESAMTYQVALVATLPQQPGEVVSESKRQTVTNVDGLECRHFHNVDGVGEALLLETSTDQATLYLDEETFRRACEQRVIWRYLALERVLAGEKLVVLRAAHLLLEGKSLLVLAPSGRESSEFAQQFAQANRCTLLNERYTILQESDRGWLAYGTPMNGIHAICRNGCAPVAAVLNLCHGSDAGLFPMTETRKNRRLEEEVQWNTWNDGYIRYLLPSVRDFAHRVPFYDAYLTGGREDVLRIRDDLKRM